jgi:S1-C subfamily serine protease
MFFKIRFLRIFFLGFFVVFLHVVFGFAERMYVTDVLKLPLRSGPGTEYKILALVESGQEVEIMEFRKDWSLVKLSNQKIGYVLTRYLISEPASSILLQQLQAKYKELTEQAATLYKENSMLKEEIKDLRVALDKFEKSKEEKSKLTRLAASGTGFFVAPSGYAVTNYHVVENCQRLLLNIRGEQREATIIAKDEANDLALIKVFCDECASVKFRPDRRSELGESIMVAGYPLKGLLASDLNVTDGTISALAGIGDDPRLLQITAPVQLGNSGGPLLDAWGKVIGVVVGKLDSAKAFKLTGDLPQNVNFAIKGVILRSFLDINGVDYEIDQSKMSKNLQKIASEAMDYTFSIDCWR